jgi:hypothetical protein
MVASPEDPDTVKLAISAALISFAPCMRLKAGDGVPHTIAKLPLIRPIHAILFFPFFFLVNYYPTAAA